MKYKKYAGVLIALICALGFLQLCPFSFAFHTSDTSKGKQIMKKLAAQNVADIDAKIQAIQEELKPKEENVSSFSARFANTIVMGDSLARGLLDYRLLPSNVVVADRGRRTSNIDGDIQTVIGYAPKVIFMEYGLNDLGYTNGQMCIRDRAKAFVKFVCNDKELQQVCLPNIPVRTSLQEYYKKDIFMQEAYKANEDTLVNFTNNLPHWNDVRSVFYKQIQTLLTKEKTPKQVAEAIDSECNKAVYAK